MNSTPDGKNNMPPEQNKKHSVEERSIRQGSAPVKQANRPVPRPSNAVHTARKAPQRTTQQPQRPQPVQARKPVQNAPQRTPQNAPQRKAPDAVKRVPQNAQTRPVTKAKKTPAKKTETKMNKSIVMLLVGAVIVLVLVLAGAKAVMFFNDENDLLIREVTIEAGSQRPELSMFFSAEPTFPNLVSCNLNFDEVNIDLPQTISFNINIYGKNNACKLLIQDSIPPVGEGVPQKIFASQDLPDAMDCITNINDITDVSATWRDVPDMSNGGNFIAVAALTDGCGNETLVNVPFEVTKDSTPPEIKGALDIEAYIGDSISYRETLIVTDDYDANPSITIDTSAVNVNEEGTYDVVYTATDFSGNETSVTITLTMMEKPEGYVEPEVVYEEARKILDEITEPGMTDEEVCLQIIWWCRYNINFILRTYSDSWTEAAYNAFIYRSGNCYSTVYAVKALLDVAGIENMIIERYPYETATHFWNYVHINGQWYHCDATWRQGYDSYFFMYTTEELLDFWQGGWNGFQFDEDKYPESATESVQDRIDYRKHTIEPE